jgi:hypothetical protein
MMWYDTANNILYMRSEADDAWIVIGTLNQSTNTFIPAGSLTLASQAEAETGTDNTKVMTPLRAAQAIAALSASGSLLSAQVFTSSGTWTRPTDVTKVLMFVTGGGGGPGNASGEDGGGAGTAIKFLDVTSVPSATITVGAGGLPSTSPTAGGLSRWSGGGDVTGFGAVAGSSNNNGSASGGDINLSGGRGGTFWGVVQGVSTVLNTIPGHGAYFGDGLNNRNGRNGIVWVLEFA